MKNRYLLCSDLDRTLLPNGFQEESLKARPLLRALVDTQDITLVYVSGRDKGLLLDAIKEYDLPMPHYAIGDVGTTIYEIKQQRWVKWSSWSEELDTDWNGRTYVDLMALFADINELNLQEESKQNEHKLSYYVSTQTNRVNLFTGMEKRLAAQGYLANLIWSVDETKNQGLLDVVPKSATKLHAIIFLMQHKGFELANTVFAGDSGNDLAVLTSHIPAVLVKNAHEHVRKDAIEQSRILGNQTRLYLARGDFLAMNGNYCAGVLEGLAHYHPVTKGWMQQAISEVSLSFK